MPATIHGEYNSNAKAIQVDSSGNLIISASGSTLGCNLTQLAGTAVAVNSGNLSAGTLRVAIASDDVNTAAIKTAVQIMDDWDESDRCKVNLNLNSGVAVDIGSGNASTGTARVAIATDDVNLAKVSAAIGQDAVTAPANVAVIGGVNVGGDGKSYALKTGGGNVGVNTLDVTIASNDANISKVVTALEIMDDWDSSDTCKVTLAAQTLTAVAVSKDGSANATGNRIFTASNVDQVAGTSVSVNSGNKDAGCQRVVLATDDVNASAMLTSLQLIDDAVSTEGSTAATKGLMCQGDDGTNARNWKMDSNGQGYVLLGATISGEDVANDRMKVQVASNVTYSPAKTTTTINAAGKEILASTDILAYKTVRLWIKNTHGSNAFTACTVYISPDGTSEHALDATAVTTAFGTLAIGTLNSYAVKGGGATVGDGARYIRVTASANSDTGSCDVWLTGSVL